MINLDMQQFGNKASEIMSDREEKNYAYTSTSKNLAKTEENKEIQSSNLNHQQLFRSLREADSLALKNFTGSNHPLTKLSIV